MVLISSLIQRVSPVTMQTLKATQAQLSLQEFMETTPRPVALGFGLGMLVALATLFVFGRLSLRSLFIVSFLWLLVCSEVFITSYDATFSDNLRWIKVGGWVILAYIVFERVTAVVW